MHFEKLPQGDWMFGAGRTDHAFEIYLGRCALRFGLPYGEGA